MRWLIFLLAIPALSAEREHAEAFCAEVAGKDEVYLEDGSRVDCLTPAEAIEVDYSAKWAEGIGQALLYSRLTGREPAVALIVDAGSAPHLARFHNAADGLSIRLYVIPKRDP